MTDRPDPPMGRPSRRAVLAAPAGLAVPAGPTPADEDAVGLCRVWLENRAEMMRLLTRWADIEADLIEHHGWGGLSKAKQASLPQARILRAIDARLDVLGDERETLAPRLPLSKATSREGVMLKFEVVQSELCLEDFPVIHGLLKTAICELDALW